MPPLTTTCPKCKKVFQIKNEMLGKQCRCANCQTRFVINADSANKPPTNPTKKEEEELVVVEFTSTPQTTQPSKPVLESSDAAIELEVVSAEAVDHAMDRKISSFEELADKLVSARSEANNKSAYDASKFLAYSTNSNLVSRDSAIERSTRLAIHGGAMMLLALMLLPFVFLGIHVTGWAWTCPIGGLLASFLGCIGALLTTFALFRRSTSSAVLFGFAPGAAFLMSGGLIFFLLINSYWGSPISERQTQTRSIRTNQSTPTDQRSNRRFPNSSPSSRRFRN